MNKENLIAALAAKNAEQFRKELRKFEEEAAKMSGEIYEDALIAGKNAVIEALLDLLEDATGVYGISE